MHDPGNPDTSERTTQMPFPGHPGMNMKDPIEQSSKKKENNERKK